MPHTLLSCNQKVTEMALTAFSLSDIQMAFTIIYPRLSHYWEVSSYAMRGRVLRFDHWEGGVIDFRPTSNHLLVAPPLVVIKNSPLTASADVASYQL